MDGSFLIDQVAAGGTLGLLRREWTSRSLETLWRRVSVPAICIHHNFAQLFGSLNLWENSDKLRATAGGKGISIDGGDTATLQRSNNVVSDNLVRDFQRCDRHTVTFVGLSSYRVNPDV